MPKALLRAPRSLHAHFATAINAKGHIQKDGHALEHRPNVPYKLGLGLPWQAAKVRQQRCSAALAGRRRLDDYLISSI